MQVELPDDDKSDLQLIYRKQELREFSICNVPANPNALVEQPEKTDDKQEKPLLFGADTNVESIKADIEEIAIDIKEIQLDIENLKTVQMEMSDKVDKDNTDFYASLFEKEKPSDQERLEPFSQLLHSNLWR